MKAIHLTAALALALVPLTSASAATNRDGASPVVGLSPVGETDVPGDFNDDGNPDLLFQNSFTGDQQVWLLSRTKPTERMLVNQHIDPSFMVVGTDDFNGDERTDILFWDPATGNGQIWYLDGTTYLDKSVLRLDLPEYTPVSVLDYNRDGNPDILFQSHKSGNTFVALLQGANITRKVVLDLPSADVQTTWKIVGTGDFDRDGDDDLVVYRSGTDTRTGVGFDLIGVALMEGTTGRVTVITEISDRNWVVRAVSDFSRDGWPDLYFENVATGETGVWEMEGLKIRQKYVVTGMSDQERGWHIVGPR